MLLIEDGKCDLIDKISIPESFASKDPVKNISKSEIVFFFIISTDIIRSFIKYNVQLSI